MNTCLKKTTVDKLIWLTSQNPDPKRSQIHLYIIDNTPQELENLLFFERYQTIYYDYVAGYLLDLIKEPDKHGTSALSILSKNREQFENFIDTMYNDAKDFGFWGFILDW